MRKWIPATGISALAATGLLLTSHPKPVDAQVVAAAPTLAADTVFLAGGVDIDSTKGVEAVKPVTVSFQGRQVLSADVVLKGFEVRFVDAEHMMHEEKVKIENVQVNGENVKFDARLALRDNSGTYDDTYSGHIDYVVLARVR